MNIRIPYVWSHYLSEVQDKILKKNHSKVVSSFLPQKTSFNPTNLFSILFVNFYLKCDCSHSLAHVHHYMTPHTFFLQPVSDFNHSSTTNIFLCYKNLKGLLVFSSKNKIQRQMLTSWLTWLSKVFNVVLSKSITSKASFKGYFASKFAFKICP